jgi:hypothetical protein
MKTLATLILAAASFAATAQTTITNGDFENWGGNASPGIVAEPTGWYSNQSGSSTAMLGGQTCFKDATTFHGGLFSARIETISGPLATVINGNVTTGVINAPSFSKADGYIGTANYSTASDIRRRSFTGRPDSLVGWYKYTPGGAGEQGKVRAILHINDYDDPETPTAGAYHTNPTANKIGDVLFLTPTTAVTTWTRFSVPFTYVSAASPAYIMINVTSSANQTTTITGSKLWLDDLQTVYASTSSTCGVPTGVAVTAVTATTAILGWTEPTGSIGSQYKISTTSGAPTTSGTGTTTLTQSLTSLTSATTYYASVRDSCGATDLSSWVTVPFTTLHPAGVTNINSTDFGITAFPNPAKDEVTITATASPADNAVIELTDLSGRVLTTAAVTTNSITISVAGLPSGIYLARYTDAAHTQTIRISKQ